MPRPNPRSGGGALAFTSTAVGAPDVDVCCMSRAVWGLLGAKSHHLPSCCCGFYGPRPQVAASGLIDRASDIDPQPIRRKLLRDPVLALAIRRK